MNLHVIAAALAAALLSTAAFAQAPPPGPGPRPPGPEAGGPPPPMGAPGARPGRPDAPPPDGPGERTDKAPPPPRFGPRPPPPKGAHFRFEQGDMGIDVKCADDEPMRACADITMQLMDKLATMQARQSGPASPPPAPPR